MLVAGCGGGDGAPGALVYQGREGLALVEADGSDARLILPERNLDARHADWSRDGSRLTFVVDEADGTRDIWVAAADGSGARRIVDCAEPCVETDAPAWSPDGADIAFYRSSESEGVGPSVRLQTVDPETLELTTIVTTGRRVDAPRWSPDGTRLVVDLSNERADVDDPSGTAIAVVELDAEQPVLQAITPWALSASYPDWHPTDDLIVFQAGRGDPFAQTGEPQQLFTIRPDGTELTRLTERTTSDPWLALPAWVPDGSGLLVTVIRGDGDFALARLGADGQRLEDIVDPDTGDRIVGAHARQAPPSPD